MGEGERVAEQERGLNEPPTWIRGIIFVVWAVVSTIAYGIVCIAVGLVSRAAARGVGGAWCRHLLAVGGVRLSTEGIKKLDPNGRYVFLSNHGSALDIPVLIVGLPYAVTFMAKKELFRIPFFGWGITVLGHIPVDRSSARKARESIVRAAERIAREAISLILFPEGTRSETGEVGEFKQGSLALAQRAGVPVVPVLLEGTHRVLGKKKALIRPGTVRLIVGDPISAAEARETDKRELADCMRNAIIQMRAEAAATRQCSVTS
ncbi:MAG: 1-acylglycerol-3-phosphate O-acyltransferase [Chitinivibrionales bacterium]|nr:1-acylglycerol-3-phosphate O-acyltransferase [Chitinivibrionales bacterium]MBD3358966.1 1-acylglycerol-3-phosphate O-acyltransferase [Chitinivibrionales bacterium]